MLAKQTEIQKLVDQILGKQQVSFTNKDYTLVEKLSSETASIEAIISFEIGEADASGGSVEKKTVPSNYKLQPHQNFSIIGRGVGPIDAFFNAIFQTLSGDYPSTRNLHFSYFKIKGMFDASDPNSRADATAEVVIGIENSLGKEFRFSTHDSRSIIHGSFDCLLKAAAYFVNAELAFIDTYSKYQKAKQENREETATKLTTIMAEMVENAPYSATIDLLKSGLKK